MSDGHFHTGAYRGETARPTTDAERDALGLPDAKAQMYAERTDTSLADSYYDAEKAAVQAILQRQAQHQEMLRQARHQAWLEGYEACKRGDQMHSPYRPAPDPDLRGEVLTQEEYFGLDKTANQRVAEGDI